MNQTAFYMGYTKVADRQPLDMPPAGEPDYIENGDVTANPQAGMDVAYKKGTKPQARDQQKGTGYE